jgi:hypothetical protein
MKDRSTVIDEDVYRILGAAKVIQNYRSHGAGGLKQLEVQLKRWRKLLGDS